MQWMKCMFIFYSFINFWCGRTFFFLLYFSLSENMTVCNIRARDRKQEMDLVERWCQLAQYHDGNGKQVRRIPCIPPIVVPLLIYHRDFFCCDPISFIFFDGCETLVTFYVRCTVSLKVVAYSIKSRLNSFLTRTGRLIMRVWLPDGHASFYPVHVHLMRTVKFYNLIFFVVSS